MLKNKFLQAIPWIAVGLALSAGQVAARDFTLKFDLVTEDYQYLEEPDGGLALSYPIPDEYAQVFQDKAAGKIEQAAGTFLEGKKSDIKRLMLRYDKELGRLSKAWSKENFFKSKKARQAEIDKLMGEFKQDYEAVQRETQKKVSELVLLEFADLKNKEDSLKNIPLAPKDVKTEVDEEDFGLSKLFEEEALPEDKKGNDKGGQQPSQDSGQQADMEKKYPPAAEAVKKRVAEVKTAADKAVAQRTEAYKAVEAMRNAPSKEFTKKSEDGKGPIYAYESSMEELSKLVKLLKRETGALSEIVSKLTPSDDEAKKKLADAKSRLDTATPLLDELEKAVKQGEEFAATIKGYVGSVEEKKVKKEAQGVVKQSKAWNTQIAKLASGLETALKELKTEYVTR